jgi:hypothetical protein
MIRQRGLAQVTVHAAGSAAKKERHVVTTEKSAIHAIVAKLFKKAYAAPGSAPAIRA